MVVGREERLRLQCPCRERCHPWKRIVEDEWAALVCSSPWPYGLGQRDTRGQKTQTWGTEAWTGTGRPPRSRSCGRTWSRRSTSSASRSSRSSRTSWAPTRRGGRSSSSSTTAAPFSGRSSSGSASRRVRGLPLGLEGGVDAERKQAAPASPDPLHPGPASRAGLPEPAGGHRLRAHRLRSPGRLSRLLALPPHLRRLRQGSGPPPCAPTLQADPGRRGPAQQHLQQRDRPLRGLLPPGGPAETGAPPPPGPAGRPQAGPEVPEHPQDGPGGAGQRRVLRDQDRQAASAPALSWLRQPHVLVCRGPAAVLRGLVQAEGRPLLVRQRLPYADKGVADQIAECASVMTAFNAPSPTGGARGSSSRSPGRTCGSACSPWQTSTGGTWPCGTAATPESPSCRAPRRPLSAVGATWAAGTTPSWSAPSATRWPPATTACTSTGSSGG
eukprot:XP_001705803.1 Hypothetical protein GL50803_113282 [Giardia lamblia ATCC 50803]